MRRCRKPRTRRWLLTAFAILWPKWLLTVLLLFGLAGIDPVLRRHLSGEWE